MQKFISSLLTPLFKTLHKNMVNMILCTDSFPSRLLLVNFDDIVLLHLQSLRSFVIVDASSVKEEPETGHRNPHPLAVRLLQLAHLGGLLDPEVDFVAVLSDNLQLDVLGLVTHLVRFLGFGFAGSRCVACARKMAASGG